MLFTNFSDIHAATRKPREGWTKVLITAGRLPDGRVPTSDETRLAIQNEGGEELHSYGNFVLAYFPESAAANLERTSQRHGWQFELREDFETIFLPRVTVDTRRGYPAAIAPKSPTTQGRSLYVVQLIGPAVETWLEQIRSTGAVLVQAVPHNAFIIAARPEAASAVEALAFVQWLDDYRSAAKAKFVDQAADRQRAIVQLADVEEQHDVIASLKETIDADLRVERYANDVLVHLTATGSQLMGLVAHEIVLGVHPALSTRPSDERQALSATSFINATGDQPTNPTQYDDWLASICPSCTNLNAEGFRVGIVDTGLDGGNGGVQHADLAGRQTFGASFTTHNDPCVTCDRHGHGTMVAGVIAGNASTGLTDGGGFFFGMGIAPSVGVFSTKIFSIDPNNNPTGTIFNWAHDARSNGVAIQNHSHNEYAAPANGHAQLSGQYTLMSRQYDFAVRDSDGSWGNGVTPITLTVSAGNIDQSGTDPNALLVLAPATAKNVIAVGGAENFRPDQNFRNCRNTQADAFRNLNSNSKRGTLAPGVLKPDLVAPASMMITTRSTQQVPQPWCVDNFDGNNRYNLESGTSFAAPAAAAAAVLLSRKFNSTPTAATPALLKAMLVAGARSMRDGIDRRTATAVGARPNARVGFGLLSLTDLLGVGVWRTTYNTASPFTNSGQSWSRSFTVGAANQPVTIALAWSDAPAAAGATFPLVNNLDLIVKAHTSSGCLYQFVGNKTDGTTENSVAYGCSASVTRDNVNNVEIVRFQPGYVMTTFTVEVRGTAINGQGVPLGATTSQDYSLYVINGY